MENYYFIQNENDFYLYESIDYIPKSLLSHVIYVLKLVHNGICKRYHVEKVIQPETGPLTLAHNS